ncbi:MAG TPA: peptidoglycan-binding domain-containing protein [Actinophytocola sp.]|uniref:peptidoglycan-binding domain-containing protein n=1 Tax=Actinophytocola sp. TaxID=1872138 RepID=UPI002DDD1655|nr:peptidoglycan-binding domain-containing protein [Actinophytocola sp.]HEV2778578.1 peptidoglycan-binding domain-containing protein [Actinophytocola sp.]
MADEPDLSPGVSSEWVSYLQQMLNHNYQQTVVDENGSFDDATASAVAHFRDQNGLPSGSHVDSACWDALLGRSSAPADSSGNGGDAGASAGTPVSDGGAGGASAGSAPDGGAGGAPPSGNDGAEGAGPTGDSDGEAPTTERGLTAEEVSAAYSVFHDTLNTDSIVLTEGGVLAVGGYARTLPDYVTFPDGTLSKPDGDFMAWLIHELGHCWQYQQGASVPGLILSALGGDYDYGGEQGLRDAAAVGQPFSDFGYEEQASIFADYYRRLGGDTSAYDPYIQSVWDGTWQSAPKLPE